MSKARFRKPQKKLANKADTIAEGVVETTVFRSGNSDAVRLPTRFGLLGKRVRVRRLGHGTLIIETRRKRAWPSGFLESFGRLTEDFTVPARPAADTDDDRRLAALFRHESE